MDPWPCCCDKDPATDGGEFVAQQRWEEEDGSDGVEVVDAWLRHEWLG